MANGVKILEEAQRSIKGSKRASAMFLSELENILIDHPVLYEKIRKLFLDTINNMVRQELKQKIGPIEDLVK